MIISTIYTGRFEIDARITNGGFLFETSFPISAGTHTAVLQRITHILVPGQRLCTFFFPVGIAIKRGTRMVVYNHPTLKAYWKQTEAWKLSGTKVQNNKLLIVIRFHRKRFWRIFFQDYTLCTVHFLYSNTCYAIIMYIRILCFCQGKIRVHGYLIIRSFNQRFSRILPNNKRK